MSTTAAHSHVHPLSGLTSQVARDCLARLDTAGALADEAVVHEMRVSTKRLRAAWRLVSGLAGNRAVKRRRLALADLSAKLSGARDLTVLSKLAQHLSATQQDGRIAMALDRIVGALARKHDEAVSGFDSATLLEELRAAWEEEIAAWEALGDGDPHQLRRAIRHELRRSLHHARRDAREAMRTLDPGWWHDWRKIVKRLRYQREFVAQAQERQPGRYDTRLHRLGSRLGERNDLANLASFADTLLESADLTAAEHGLVRKAIAEAEKAIVKNCRRLGRLIFLR